MAKFDTRLDLPIDTRLMMRLREYAQARGETPESILLEGVRSFMDAHPLPEDRKPAPPQAGNR